jgi:hypothetical protein
LVNLRSADGKFTFQQVRLENEQYPAGTQFGGLGGSNQQGNLITYIGGGDQMNSPGAAHSTFKGTDCFA